jgi:5,10-methylenetetrahydromethanopterin reductase
LPLWLGELAPSDYLSIHSMPNQTHFSLQLNNRFAFSVPEYGFSGMIRLAEMADTSPFDIIAIGDSLFDSPRFEPIATLGALAVRTRKVKLAAAIIQPHFRNPIMLALSWATLDIASEGRMILALGIGGGTPDGVEAECREVGVTRASRGRVLERTVREIRALWAGTHERVNLPVRPPRENAPIWIASGIYQPGERKFSAQSGNIRGEDARWLPGALERVARLGDGWITLMADVGEVRAAISTLDDYCTRFGRPPVTKAMDFWIHVGDDREKCLERCREAITLYFNGAPISDDTLNRWSIAGPPEVCRERIAEFAAAGINHIGMVIAEREPWRQFELIVNKVIN